MVGSVGMVWDAEYVLILSLQPDPVFFNRYIITNVIFWSCRFLCFNLKIIFWLKVVVIFR